MYSVDMKDAQLILGYSDVFSDDKPNLIEKIGKMNMHKTISIISELIQIRDAKCDPINIFGMEFKIPFETVLKRDYCGMNPKSLEEMIENEMLSKNQHIISLQMLLILLKKLIVYGNYDSLKITDYEISDEDYRDVIMLQLLVADEVSEKQKICIDTDHFLYSTYHLNYQRNVANEFQRMHYMMECLSTNPQIFDDDIKAEYRDYYGDFTSRYGVTPTEYSSLLFWELQYYYSEKNALSQLSCWRNIDLIYKDAKEKEKISKVIDILKIEPFELKKWAEKTETEEWDFTLFYKFPFILDGESSYISVSDITLINAFFEKIFWLIRDCYSQEDSRAMAFFGRLFERYIQDATKDVCGNNYIYIDEFSYLVKKGKRKSSDAYIRKDNNLLVVEAKGFSVLVDCMAKNERIETNNRKLFVKPILQADECLNGIFDKKEEFSGIKEIFIVSVTLDNINAVPNYYNAIHEEIDENKKCGLVRYYFNFSIEEYEMLLYLIECGEDIFSILREYFSEDILSPFSNYARERVSEIGMTKFMEKNYKAATDKMKSILW
mgnify:CR=1 FL=1